MTLNMDECHGAKMSLDIRRRYEEDVNDGSG
jgi:hypothetical protein